VKWVSASDSGRGALPSTSNFPKAASQQNRRVSLRSVSECEDTHPHFVTFLEEPSLQRMFRF
jgi:hypothetical protein